ncbi:type I 3-dehydroquinate dehydratase [Candidatus Micrarchaeota archaeon]|nr:type I 3-dehydroquinate dehydratase [Candidatus Micrarchaeota archaeon]
MICVSLAAKNTEEAIAALKNQKFAEIRLDGLEVGNTKEVREIVTFARNNNKKLIATCRASQKRNEAKRVELLLEAIASGANYVDVEIETQEEHRKRIVEEAKKKKCQVIVSYHNYEKTPSVQELEKIIETGFVFDADIVKVACKSNSEEDNQRLLNLLKTSGRRLLVIGMGEIGKKTRILGPLMGSEFTFAADEKGGSTAPGQMTVSEMKEIYRKMKIYAPEFRLYGVVGKPISHSKSPKIQNVAINGQRIEGRYVRIASLDEQDALRSAYEIGMSGLNVTSPYKEAIFRETIKKDETSQKTEATNTLKYDHESGKWEGYNTDSYGVEMALKENNVDISGKKAVVIGAGGAAKTAVLALRNRGAKRIIIANRTIEKAREIAQKFNCEFSGILEEELETALEDCKILISCIAAAQRIVPKRLLRKEMVVMDANYSKESPLLSDAKEIGLQIIDAREWLLYQGAKAFEIFTNKKAPVAKMKQELYREEAQNKKDKSIALIGFMGSGKTTVGKLLSKHLKKDLIDLDQKIELKTGKSISEIFERYGEDEFRRIETEELQKALEGDAKVIACGGGAILRRENLEQLEKNAVVIWLFAQPETIIKRTKGNEKRPLLKSKTQKERIERIYSMLEQRIPLYSQCADLVISTERKTVENITKLIADEVGKAREN